VQLTNTSILSWEYSSSPCHLLLETYTPSTSIARINHCITRETARAVYCSRELPRYYDDGWWKDAVVDYMWGGMDMTRTSHSHLVRFYGTSRNEEERRGENRPREMNTDNHGGYRDSYADTYNSSYSKLHTMNDSSKWLQWWGASKKRYRNFLKENEGLRRQKQVYLYMYWYSLECCVNSCMIADVNCAKRSKRGNAGSRLMRLT